MHKNSEIMERKKILVLAPHADDEVLGCGGYLLHEAKKGSQIKIVIATIFFNVVIVCKTLCLHIINYLVYHTFFIINAYVFLF